jgi:single-stranded-DNA-specific exonuclease
MLGSALGKRWRLRDESTGLPATKHELIVRLFRLRGINDTAAARAFMHPALPQTIELPNLALALDRIARALAEGERIAVYGDYDADGITATAVLVEGLHALGADVHPYIPNRVGEGYGLNETALRALAERGTRLVIAVDTGTSAVSEVAYANERLLDVVIVDHHTPKAELPDAVAVVNPHLDGTPDEFRFLSGCGVAFCVLLALAERLGRSLDPAPYLDLVAIGTVCDVVPLSGANRALVVEGLKQLATRARPGLAALLEAARFRGKPTAHTLGFIVGPRLNAAGRLDHGLKSYELLVTRDEARARELAAELEELNRRRQQLTAEAVALCRGLAAAECAGAPLVMVGHPEIGAGIVGLVAARLADEHVRPAIVFTRGEQFSTGSARSIEGFNIHLALSQGGHLMERFGGHHQAGGFTVRTERVEQLRDLLTAWAATAHDWSEAVPTITADFELPVDLPLDPWEVLDAVEHLEPCGTENPSPVFVARNALVRDARVTADGKHLRLRLDRGPGRRPWPAIAFGMATHLPRPGERIDLVYEVSEDTFGEPRPQLRIKDLARVT